MAERQCSLWCSPSSSCQLSHSALRVLFLLKRLKLQTLISRSLLMTLHLLVLKMQKLHSSNIMPVSMMATRLLVVLLNVKKSSKICKRELRRGTAQLSQTFSIAKLIQVPKTVSLSKKLRILLKLVTTQACSKLTLVSPLRKSLKTIVQLWTILAVFALFLSALQKSIIFVISVSNGSPIQIKSNLQKLAVALASVAIKTHHPVLNQSSIQLVDVTAQTKLQPHSSHA